MNLKESLTFSKVYKSQVIEEEAIELYNAVINTPLGAVVEVGSATGGTTVVLIGAAEEVKKIVYSVDPYPEEFEGRVFAYEPGLMKNNEKEFKDNIFNGLWKNIYQYKTDVEGCIDYLPKELSVVFIDGCHELSCVKKELALLFPRLVENGVIYVHDIYWEIGQINNTQDCSLSLLKDYCKIYNDVQVLEFIEGRTMLKICKT